MNLQIFQVLLLLITECGSVIINSTDKMLIEKPVGATVKMPCRFTLAPEDIGPLEIEWTRFSHGQTPDLEIIVYSSGQVFDHYYAPLKNRVYFSSSDPRTGDGSIDLQQLNPSDSGTYKCQVKKAPGIKSIKFILQVLLPPSKPLCSTKGTTEVGKDVILHCKAEKGASPIDYIWQRTTGSKTLPSSALLVPAAGKVQIIQASEIDSGTYRCTARNRVGVEECFLELQITHPSMAAIISATVVSVVLGLGVITFIIYCWCKSKGDVVEEDTPKDIREDASPPKCRKLATTDNV